ncbi:GGDEF domain-containing protein [Paraglaciecola aquimarina]|uniref:diguanylate cyclase n=1 Tax=Paraglaciecola algarum TaxID=3050085 RepID=A0ABS9D2W2_9ALTE|nr:GGDEF domain-containing protein [Paraglaciecola sp. G1-23]MCF2947253.1 GGDEF domain-containing protein [Paraglaciecola sp. G1-23]
MNEGFSNLVTHIGDFLDKTQDGYAIFSMDDVLIGCNQAFADILYLNTELIIGQTFEQLYREIYKNQKGPIINTTDIDQWLIEANKKRRSRDFRIFEIDLKDGRWFLVSEQISDKGELLLHAKNITKQKVLEHNLHQHTSELSNLAATDELTQISNRRSFISQVSSEINRCERNKLPACFCLLDIDYFKKVNDEYGHITGDQVLVELAEVINSLLREYDPFGRIGGEEFGLFFPDTTIEQGQEICQRLCELIVATNFNSPAMPINITVSIGVVEYWQGATFEQLYSQADNALYEAKDAGRNQIAIHD